jgi:rod shape-determining protein MreD
MSRARVLIAVVALLVALVLQVSVLGPFAWQGVVPNLVLLVVVACGLTMPASQAMVIGFAAGVLLDLAPPADHVAGRWALALSVVAFVVARVRPDVRPTAVGVVAVVAAASFVGSSLYALSGVLLSDPAVGIGGVLQVVLISLALDVLLTPIVMPGLLRLFTRLDPQQAVA